MHLLHVFFNLYDVFLSELDRHQMWSTILVTLICLIAKWLSWNVVHLWTTIVAIILISHLMLAIKISFWIIMKDQTISTTRRSWANIITIWTFYIWFIWAWIRTADIASLGSIILLDIVTWVHASLAPSWSSPVTLSYFLISISFWLCSFSTSILSLHPFLCSVSWIV